jgi:hypothetical protein
VQYLELLLLLVFCNNNFLEVYLENDCNLIKHMQEKKRGEGNGIKRNNNELR